jgi:tetratricopeptide (TPR) repeat protein
MTIAQDEGNVNSLLERLSGLPLALTQAAAYIVQTGVSIVRYLEYYDGVWKDLMVQQDESPLQEYAQRSVLTTWKISYEQVKSQSGEASNLLHLWSFLYAGDLWYELIACAKEFGAETSVPSWLTVLAQNRLKFDRALSLLIKYSLVEGKAETASYAMHSVLHSWCRYLGESEAEKESFWKLAVYIVEGMVPSKSTEEYWVLQRRLLPHGQMILHGMKSKTRAATDVNETWIYENLAGMFADQDRYKEAEELYERALAGSEKALGPEHTSTLDTVSNLGNLYAKQDRLAEAEAMYERALAGQEKALGPEHRSTFGTVSNLGILYAKQGRLAEAEKMYERSLAGQEKALGAEHTSTLGIVNNLGLLYSDQGKLAEAETTYTRALAGYEKALGPEHTDTLGTINNLANLYSDQDKLPEAETMYTRALAGYEKALGAEHTSTLMTVNNLGLLYSDQGKLAEAEAMYTRALAGKEKALGPEHRSTLDTVNNLGNLYAKQGRLAEAEAMYERALAGKEKALGPKHTSTLDTVNNLGNLYAKQDRLAEAEAMYERALAGSEKALGPEHTSTLDTVNNLGALYANQGRLAEAEAMYERALAGRKKTLGPELTSTVDLAHRLSALRMLLREPAPADASADYKAAFSGYYSPQLSHDATRLSFSSTAPELMSQVEQKEHRPRKRDALLRKFRLRTTASDTKMSHSSR